MLSSGIETSRTVPLEGNDVISSVPSRVKTCSRIQANSSPSSRAGSNPAPSLEIRSVAVRLDNFNSMAVLAWLCRTICCSASCATRNKQLETSKGRTAAALCSENSITIPHWALASRHSFLIARGRPRYSSMKGCRLWDKSRIVLEMSETCS